VSGGGDDRRGGRGADADGLGGGGGEPLRPLDDDLEDSGPRTRRAILDRLPDPRDGLTRVERVVLWQLDRLQRERGGRNVATVQLYGRVIEHVPDLTEPELQAVLRRLASR